MAQRIGQNKVLGLAGGDRSLVVAEASRAGGPPRVTLAAAFPYPEGLGLDRPAELGQALGQFLRDRGFAARQAVVGVPARWVLSKPKEVPPADAATVAEALRLQVEGEFTQELRNLSFDYAGTPQSDEAATVLLVALQGKHLEQLQAMAEAARLQLAAVTPVGCVLGAATAVANGTPRQALVVSVGPGGVELAAVDGPGGPRVLRHLGGSAAPAAMLAVELRRAAFGLGGGSAYRPVGTDGGAELAPVGRGVVANGQPANGHVANGTSANGAPYANGTSGLASVRGGWQLVLWDGATLTDASRQALSDAAGSRAEAGDLVALGVAPGVSGVAPELAGAAALALAGLEDAPLAADFLHSKLAEPKPSRVPRKAVLLGAAGGLLLLVVIGAWWSLHRMQSEFDRLTEQYGAKINDEKAAKAFVQKVEYADSWKLSRGRYIACWGDLRSAVPGNSPQAYITTFNLKENMSGSVRGKAQDQKAAEAVRDQLRNAGKRFRNVTLTWDATEVARKREGQFTLNFVYVPEK